MGITVGLHRMALLFRCFQIELELRNVGFVEGGKPKYPVKHSRMRTNNKLNPHITPGRRVLSQLPHPYSLNFWKSLNKENVINKH